jgi:hypothetical protein
MPVLNPAQTIKARDVARDVLGRVSVTLHCAPDTITKPQIAQAVAAIDAELDTRIPQIAAALAANAPAFAAAATARQKAALLIITLLHRFNFL